MDRVVRRFFWSCSIVCAALLLAPAAAAQQTTIPHLEWRTLDTRYFRFFYTGDAEEWTRDVASRIDGARDAVAALVGSAPTKRVTIIVEDPNGISNGFALPLLDHPLIFLWPTPPDPSSPLGNGSWGDQLSIHEYAHIAQLTRQSRNPGVRRLAHLLPVKLGPLTVKSPRWVTEGYATFVEGRIVRRIGRPNGVWRAAVLRQWAIEGQLPTYAALDGSPRFEGGDMAYLAGSAFLEWLASRSGDSSVVHLWRRMTARQNRTFADAFTGVYGAPPDELYGRFTAELTHDALDVVEAGPRRSLLASGADVGASAGEGELVQRLRWATGAPALSRNDSMVAITLRDPKRPQRVVIWSLFEREDSSEAHVDAARARGRALDPEDVPAVASRPRPLRVLAQLGVRGGVTFSEPRFFPDGDRVLLTGLTARGDGVFRGDLYVWRWRTGVLRRVTRGAGIRHADPSPDGREAVADRCAGGRCDLVRVNLETGMVTLWIAGTRDRVFSRPRWSRGGRQIAVAYQERGIWRLGGVPSAERRLVPQRNAGASVYAPAIAPDLEWVATSEDGGIPNVERISPAHIRPRRSTNVTGAAFDPEPATDGWVYFLRLHARGLDLARIRLDSTSHSWSSHLDTTRSDYPWVTPNASGGTLDSLPVAVVASSRGYGLGPREQRLLLMGSWANEGKSIGLAYAGTDPVGKLTWLVQGQWGDRASWRGASLGAVFRGRRPLIGVEGFTLDNRPSRQGDFDAPSSLDARYSGAAMWTALDDDRVSRDLDVQALVSVGGIDMPRASSTTRSLATLDVRGALVQAPGDWRVHERARVAGTVGRTSGNGWARAIVNGAISVNGRGHELALDGMYGRVSSGPAYERFALGGLAPPLIDSTLINQRISMPVLPIGATTGDAVATLRVSLPGPIWRPYYWIGSANEVTGAWSQVVGIEGSWHTDGIWMVRVPGVRLLGGIGYVLEGVVRHHTQAYVSVSYRP